MNNRSRPFGVRVGISVRDRSHLVGCFEGHSVRKLTNLADQALLHIPRSVAGGIRGVDLEVCAKTGRFGSYLSLCVHQEAKENSLLILFPADVKVSTDSTAYKHNFPAETLRTVARV